MPKSLKFKQMNPKHNFVDGFFFFLLKSCTSPFARSAVQHSGLPVDLKTAHALVIRLL